MSEGEREGFRSNPNESWPLCIRAKIMCSRIAWYVGIGQVQELHASSAVEASQTPCVYHC